MTLGAWAGLAALVAGLVALVVWLAQRNGRAKAEATIQGHMKEATENAAKMRRTAEDGVRAAGDGTAGSLLEPWNRD